MYVSESWCDLIQLSQCIVSFTVQILPFINGFSHVKKIALVSEVDIEIVRTCIQHLV